MPDAPATATPTAPGTPTPAPASTPPGNPADSPAPETPTPEAEKPGQAEGSQPAATPSTKQGEQAADDVNPFAAPDDEETPPQDPGEAPKTDDAADGEQAPPELQLSLPETSVYDQTHLDATLEFARTHGLSQAAAEALLARDHELATAADQRETAFWEQKGEELYAELKAHPKLGGAALKSTLNDAADGFALVFGAQSPVAKILAASHLNFHPDIVGGFAELKRKVSEPGGLVQGDGPRTKTTKRDWFPNTKWGDQPRT